MGLCYARIRWDCLKIHVDLFKMRKQKNTNFKLSKTSKIIKIGPIETKNGTIKVHGLYAGIRHGVVSKSTWIFSKIRKPKNSNFQLSKTSKIIKINRIATKNGAIEVEEKVPFSVLIFFRIS